MTGLPPVIVIGMHRSGTTLLSQLLQRAGVFMGARQNRNAEARFTNSVNGWLFRQASATWDRPEGMADLLADERLRPWLIDYIDGILRGPAALKFLGPTRFLRHRTPFRLEGPWGFKDPRTTYTLDLWLQLFPRARVVHIIRHGVDVAASLKVRRERALAANVERYRRHRALYLLRPDAPKRRGLGPQPRCRTLRGGLELWEEYVATGHGHVAALGDRALELRYEALLQDPQTELGRVLEFAGLPVDEGAVAAWTSDLDPRRAQAWQQDPDACAVARAHGERLARWGYGSEPE